MERPRGWLSDPQICVIIYTIKAEKGLVERPRGWLSDPGLVEGPHFGVIIYTIYTIYTQMEVVYVYAKRNCVETPAWVSNGTGEEQKYITPEIVQTYDLERRKENDQRNEDIAKSSGKESRAH